MSTIDRAWAPVPAWRIYANWLAFSLCVVLSWYALDQLARYQLRSHLDRAAGAVLGAVIHASSPHHWSARVASAVVAGKPFGTTRYSFDSSGLRMQAQGQPIEIGLEISGAIDLRRHAHLEIELAGGDAGSLAVVVRRSLDSSTCSSASVAFNAGTSTLSVDLRRLQWVCAGKPSEAPDRAAILRLRLQLDPGTELTVVNVKSNTTLVHGETLLDELQLPLIPTLQDPHAFERALDRASADDNDRLWPLFQLSTHARVEQTLLARDLIGQRIADATIIANGRFPEVARLAREWKPEPQASDPGARPFWILGIYALFLLWIRFKPPPSARLRAVLELLGVTAVPLSLIMSGAIGDEISHPMLAAAAMTLAFALSLLIGSAPAQPGARTMKRGWWVALVSIGIAIGLVLITGSRLPESMPHYSQVLHYFLGAAILQFVICVVVSERIERVCGSALWASLCAALVFALLTTPNAMLMQLSFAGGLIWVWNWQRHRALLANILSQTACAVLLVNSLPAEWLRSGEVSARFFLN